MGTTQFGYDAENRLVSISSASHSATFTYGFDGFLVKQVVDGVETRFVRGTGFLCLQERDSSNNVTRSYVWDSASPGGIGGLLEMAAGGAYYKYLYDGKGNVRAVVDASQNVVASYSYDEFGVQVAESGTLDQPYRFSTKRYYAGFGLNYYGYRFYSASLGRWMSRDPLGEEGGLNLYAAMGNNSVNRLDFFGLLSEEALATVNAYLEEGRRRFPDNPEKALEVAVDDSIADRDRGNQHCEALSDTNHYLWALQSVKYGEPIRSKLLNYAAMSLFMNPVYTGVKAVGLPILQPIGLFKDTSRATTSQLAAGWEGAWNGLTGTAPMSPSTNQGLNK